MKKILFVRFLWLQLLFSSCSPKLTLGQKSPKMYEEKPLKLVIMPPINETDHVEAKEFFYTTLYAPLCEKGYYVYSPYMLMDLFQSESAYDSEQFIDGDLSMFGNVLDADAAIFTTVKIWQKHFGRVEVSIEYKVRSVKTGETLFLESGTYNLDTSVNAGGGLIGSIASLAATAISTALTEKVEAGRLCNVEFLTDLPTGKYHPMHGSDRNIRAKWNIKSE